VQFKFGQIIFTDEGKGIVDHARAIHSIPTATHHAHTFAAV
jgi:hypothetical protein